MATVSAADEHAEAMEQVGGEERAAEAVEAMEQVEEEEEVQAEAEEEAAEDEPAETMEQGEGDEPAEVEPEAPAEEEAEASDEGHEEAMEQAEEGEEIQAEEAEEEEVQAEAPEEAAEAEALSTVLPLSRVKKIMRVDREIKKVTAEASLLVAAATELFLGSLAAGAHAAAVQRGRRGLRGADVRAAARAHRPTADFLLDCLPAAEEAPRAARAGSDGAAAAGAAAAAAAPKPLPRGTRRIDGFFQKVT